MTVAKKKPETPPPAVTVEVDERWMADWIGFGFVGIEALLAAYAGFDEYLRTHPQPEEQQP